MENDYYIRNKKPTDYSSAYLRTEANRMHEKVTVRVTIKREGIISFFIIVESSRHLTEVDYTTTIDPKQLHTNGLTWVMQKKSFMEK